MRQMHEMFVILGSNWCRNVSKHQTLHRERKDLNFVVSCGYHHLVFCQKLPKHGVESALCSNMPTGLVDIYEVKHSQRHLLAAIENNRLVSPIELNLKNSSSGKNKDTLKELYSYLHCLAKTWTTRYFWKKLL